MVVKSSRFSDKPELVFQTCHMVTVSFKPLKDTVFSSIQWVVRVLPPQRVAMIITGIKTGEVSAQCLSHRSVGSMLACEHLCLQTFLSSLFLSGC